jgi:hypothetical protein
MKRADRSIKGHRIRSKAPDPSAALAGSDNWATISLWLASVRRTQQSAWDGTSGLALCAATNIEEIEAASIGWRSPAATIGKNGLADRARVYHHAHALGLFQKRQRRA